MTVGHFRVAFISVSKRVLVFNVSYGNEIIVLQINPISI